MIRCALFNYLLLFVYVVVCRCGAVCHGMQAEGRGRLCGTVLHFSFMWALPTRLRASDLCKTLYPPGHPIGPYILNLLVCVCLSVCARAHGCECGCECSYVCMEQQGALSALLCCFSLVPLKPNLSLNLKLIFS